MDDIPTTDMSFANLEDGLAAADTALQHDDIASALAIYSVLRARFPTSPLPYRLAARALIERHRHEEAEILLDVAASLFTDDGALPSDRANLGGDEVSANESPRTKRPPDMAQTDVAVTSTAPVAAEAPIVSVDHRTILAERARLALAERHWGEALELWSELQILDPTSWLAHASAAIALREMRRFDDAAVLLAAATARFPDQIELLTEQAHLSAARADWAEALRLWQSVLAIAPNRADAIIGQATALRTLGHFDEADVALTASMAPHPTNTQFLTAFAETAHARGDWPEAARRWARLREVDPTAGIGYVQGAHALRAMGHADAADALIAQAAALITDSAEAAVEYAQIAQRAGEFAEAAIRWDAAKACFPNALSAHIGHSQCLRATGRLVEAELSLRDAAVRFPEQPLPVIELGWMVSDARRNEEAEAIWAYLRARFPAQLDGYIGGARSLDRLHRFNDAETLLADAATLFPDRPEPPTEAARIAFSRGDFADAEVKFRAILQRFPDEHPAFLGLARALAAQGRFEPAREVLTAAIAKFPASDALRRERTELIEKQRHWTGPETSMPDRPVVATPASPNPIAAPHIATTATIRLAVGGYHLANQLSQIFSKLRPLRERVDVRWLEHGSGVDGIVQRLPRDWIAGTGIYFEEATVGSAETRNHLRSMLSANCATLRFPTNTMSSLWPFLGPDSRRASENLPYQGGRYEYTDAFAASLADANMTDDILFDLYMESTEAAPIDMDALFAEDRSRWQQQDGLCDVALGDFLEHHFRERYLFTAPDERGGDIVREIARQLAVGSPLQDIFGAEQLTEALDRLTSGWQPAPRALPVHPRVARHFGLRWWTPDMIYKVRGNDLTFRDYTLRYIRWSMWLP